MRPAWRSILFAALVAALALVGELLAGGADPGLDAAPESGLDGGAAADERPTPEQAIEAERRRRRVANERALRREDFTAEAGPPAAYERQIAEQTPASLAVVRRFQTAFSRYELGALDRALRRRLRETASAGLAAELLAAPPRVPAGISAAPRARLGRLDFVPQAGDEPTARLRRAKLVGELGRGDRRDPIVFELERPPGGGWRVVGLGR